MLAGLFLLFFLFLLISKGVFRIRISYAALFFVFGMGAHFLFSKQLSDTVIYWVSTLTFFFLLLTESVKLRIPILYFYYFEAFLLASFGFLLTFFSLFVLSSWFLDLNLYTCLLFAASMSCTDGKLLSPLSKQEKIPIRIRKILEFESAGTTLLCASALLLIHSASLRSYALPEFLYVEVGAPFFLAILLGIVSGYILKYLDISLSRSRWPLTLIALALFFFRENLLAILFFGIFMGNAFRLQVKGVLRLSEKEFPLLIALLFLLGGVVLFIYPISLKPLLLSIGIIAIVRPLITFIALSFSNLRWSTRGFIALAGPKATLPLIVALLFAPSDLQEILLWVSAWNIFIYIGLSPLLSLWGKKLEGPVELLVGPY